MPPRQPAQRSRSLQAPTVQPNLPARPVEKLVPFDPPSSRIWLPRKCSRGTKVPAGKLGQGAFSRPIKGPVLQRALGRYGFSRCRAQQKSPSGLLAAAEGLRGARDMIGVIQQPTIRNRSVPRSLSRTTNRSDLHVRRL